MQLLSARVGTGDGSQRTPSCCCLLSAPRPAILAAVLGRTSSGRFSLGDGLPAGHAGSHTIMDALWGPARVAAAATAAVACCSLRPQATVSTALGSDVLTAWFPASRLRQPHQPLPPQAARQWQAAQKEAARCIGLSAGVDRGAYAIVLLNTEPGCGLLADSDSNETTVSHMLTAVWAGAAVVVVADGAANHLYDSALSDDLRRKRLPHIITGDLDSIRPDVLEYYTQAGVKTAPKPSQDDHDFTKSLLVAESKLQEHGGGEEVYVCCSAGGRFDHVAAMLSTLYKHAR